MTPAVSAVLLTIGPDSANRESALGTVAPLFITR